MTGRRGLVRAAPYAAAFGVLASAFGWAAYQQFASERAATPVTTAPPPARTLPPAAAASAPLHLPLVRWSSVGPTASSLGVHLLVNLIDGVVGGHVSPRAQVSVSVSHDGQVKVSTTATTDGSGNFAVGLRWDAGHGPGIHNGDVVAIRDGLHEYREPVSLWGFIDDRSGDLSGTAPSGSTLEGKLYTNGDLTDLAWAGAVAVGAGGHFSLGFAPLVARAPTRTPNPWEGYQLTLLARQGPDAAQFRLVQTPNTTLVGSRNLAGGGYLVPGDAVRFDLLHDGALKASASAIVDADGIPQAALAADVSDGDVLSTAFHAPSGTEEHQTLAPWRLSARVDYGADAIRGTAGPNASLVASYYGPAGVVAAFGHADELGRFTLDFGSEGIQLVGDMLVTLSRVSDPGGTGVGAEEIDFRTPFLAVDDVDGLVSGFGTPGVHAVAVVIHRGVHTLAAARGITSKEGGFTNVALTEEVVSGDVVEAVAGDSLPPFAVGEALTGRPILEQGRWVYAGAGTPGRRVDVETLDPGGPSCTSSSSVDDAGGWAVDLRCVQTGREYVVVSETVTASAPPGAAGSRLTRVVNLDAPELVLEDPAPDAAVGPSFAVTVDVLLGPVPNGVTVCVDANCRALRADASGVYGTPFTEPPGAHILYAFASTAGPPRDAAGAVIYARTAERRVTVG